MSDIKTINIGIHDPLPVGPEDIIVYRRNGNVLARQNGKWKLIGTSQEATGALQSRYTTTLNAGVTTTIPFPVKCKTDSPIVDAKAWTIDEDGKPKAQIQVYISDITGSSFKALVNDENAILQFTYGDPIII